MSTSVGVNHRTKSEVKMKLMNVFLVISLSSCLALVSGYDNTIFRKDTKVLSNSHSPLFYISGLVEDWNRKHSETSDVVVITVGKKSEMTENVLRVIPNENAVVSISPEQCRSLSPRKAAFIVVLADFCNAVSTSRSIID
jgi:hypothetical protein